MKKPIKNDPVPPPLSFACPQSWDAMRVDGAGRRFCDQCRLHVHDLSALSKREGERLLAQTGGRTCVSYRTRADGSMVVRPVWSRVFRPLTALVAVVMPLLFASCADRYTLGRTGGVMCGPKDGKDTARNVPKHSDGFRTTGAPMAVPDQTTAPNSHEAH